MAVCEILRGTSRTRDYIREGEKEGKSLLDAMEDGALEGMQTFDSELQRLIESGVLDEETGLSYASNAANLQLRLSMEGARPGNGAPPVTEEAPAPATEMDNLIER